MKELGAKLQRIPAAFDRWVRLLFLMFQSFEFMLIAVSDLHEFRSQERVENRAKENDRPDQVKRIDFDPPDQLWQQTGRLVVVILFERLREIERRMAWIRWCRGTNRRKPRPGQTQNQEKQPK